MNRLMKFGLSAALFCVWSAVGAVPLRANTHTFAFTGEVTSVDSPLTSQFSIGDLLSGVYSFDDTAVDTNASADTGFYEDALFEVTVSFDNGYSAQFDPLGISQLILVDNSSSDLYDLEIPMTGPPVSALEPDLMAITLIDNDGTMLTSDDLPTSPPETSLAETADGLLRFPTGPMTSSLVQFDLLSLTSVPEPSTAALMAFMGGMLLQWRRRSAQRAA
jgi:PEP-CTERM motif